MGTLLFAEAAENLGLEGFEGQVLTEVGGTITGAVLCHALAQKLANDNAVTQLEVESSFESLLMVDFGKKASSF